MQLVVKARMMAEHLLRVVSAVNFCACGGMSGCAGDARTSSWLVLHVTCCSCTLLASPHRARTVDGHDLDGEHENVDGDARCAVVPSTVARPIGGGRCWNTAGQDCRFLFL